MKHIKLHKVPYFPLHFMFLLDCTGPTICDSCQRIMSPLREQCGWRNHGNTVTETGEGTRRTLPCEFVLNSEEEGTLNHIKPVVWTKRMRWILFGTESCSQCEPVQYRTCRDEEDRFFSVRLPSFLPSFLFYSASLKSCRAPYVDLNKTN